MGAKKAYTHTPLMRKLNKQNRKALWTCKAHFIFNKISNGFKLYVIAVFVPVLIFYPTRITRCNRSIEFFKYAGKFLKFGYIFPFDLYSFQLDILPRLDLAIEENGLFAKLDPDGLRRGNQCILTSLI